jgi:glycosyltransferase involved in cell wall biosynthesis
MTLEPPTISAIVPVHNGAAYVAEALASIQAQEHPVSQIVVVDDGSTDESVEVARAVAPEVILIQQPQAGPAAARNAGADRASGELLAFLDHDDLWPADRTGALLQGLAAAPDAGMVYGRVRFLEMPGVSPGVFHARMNGQHSPVLFQGALIRRDVWMAAGGMDITLQSSEDLDLCLRLIDAGVRMATVEATTVIYRRHFGNLTRDEALSANAKLTVLRSAIRRRLSTRR